MPALVLGPFSCKSPYAVRRGLKSLKYHSTANEVYVAVRSTAWIEISTLYKSVALLLVAVRSTAWIEIPKYLYIAKVRSESPYAVRRGLKWRYGYPDIRPLPVAVRSTAWIEIFLPRL